eukprot:TRINITY_DN5909_c0_g1_i1.p2 TRINITY_DN5909_c0_g1~~TRINITY_DN5909_c0_g1_i1.p2  ORF type:complete len:387 (+),score=83.02 TRINITY_DN5909_c0_g1_i1:183-1343(+)
MPGVSYNMFMQKTQLGEYRTMSIENNIKNPSMKYRPVPFWSWNDKLENDELRLQIKHMHDVGLGGYFMHARGGLLTEYMSEEWFDAVDACLDKGAELEMHSWAYDENGWPSGFGDGKVNGLGEKYQQKYLRAEVVPACELKRSGHTIALYTANGKERIGENGNVKGDVLHLYYDVNEFYVDTLDREVTVKFIELIYQKYYERLDREGRSPSELAGFFTDEPQISRSGMPWSLIMEEEYRAAYSEELLDVLPHMFYREGDFRRTRYRVWKLITQLFMNNFMKPIHDWCGERGWQVTGHHVCEESYWSQLTSNGAVMPQYQYYPMYSALIPVSYTHLRAHETSLHLVCRLLLEKKKKTIKHKRTNPYHNPQTQSIHLSATAHKSWRSS